MWGLQKRWPRRRPLPRLSRVLCFGVCVLALVLVSQVDLSGGEGGRSALYGMYGGGSTSSRGAADDGEDSRSEDGMGGDSTDQAGGDDVAKLTQEGPIIEGSGTEQVEDVSDTTVTGVLADVDSGPGHADVHDKFNPTPSRLTAQDMAVMLRTLDKSGSKVAGSGISANAVGDSAKAYTAAERRNAVTKVLNSEGSVGDGTVASAAAGGGGLGLKMVTGGDVMDGDLILSPGSTAATGMVIGNAFTCKGAGGDWGCVRVFHYAEKEMRVERTAGRAFSRPNPDASRGAQLLKVLQVAGTPRLALAVALTEAHADRPLYGWTDETLVDGEGRARERALTGRQLSARTCRMALTLDHTYGVPRGGNSKSLLVVFGTQKGPDYVLLYLLGAVGNYNVVMVNAYMDLEGTLKRLKDRLLPEHVVLFVPELWQSQACAAMAVLGAGVRILLVTLTGNKGVCRGVDQPRIVAFSSLISGSGGKGSEGEEVRAVCRGPVGPAHPLMGPEGAPGTLYIVRQDQKGAAEVVVQPVTAGLKQGMEMMRFPPPPSYSSSSSSSPPISPFPARRITDGIAARGASNLAPYPTSSGDMPNLLASLLTGQVSESSLLGFARLSMVTDVMLPLYLFGSPVQIASWAEEVTLWRAIVGPDPPTYGNQSRLALCFSGGGHPNKQVEHTIVAEGACNTPFVGGWGCYETGIIGIESQAKDEKGWYTLDRANNPGWRLQSAGPYQAEEGTGELVLRPLRIMKHPEQAWNQERVEMDEKGQEWFHTRDIVESKTQKDGKVLLRQIDKTTGPFQLTGGQWVPVGLLERALEGSQSVFLNVVLFGSAELVAVVWLADRYKAYTVDRVRMELLRPLVLSLSTFGQRPWLKLDKVVVADEPWEFRPRAKIRGMLAQRFGAAVNTLEPGAVTVKMMGNNSGAYNIAVGRTARLATDMRAHLLAILRVDQALTTSGALVVEALLGCVGDDCLNRGPGGRLREPMQRYAPYDYTTSEGERLQRYDYEPWHLWDLPRPVGWVAAEAVAALESLQGHRTQLVEYLPPLIPSLGLLHDLGIRFRLRLVCAVRVARATPALFEARAMDVTVYEGVMGVCRPEWSEARISYLATERQRKGAKA